MQGAAACTPASCTAIRAVTTVACGSGQTQHAGGAAGVSFQKRTRKSRGLDC